MPKGIKGFQKGHPQFNTGRTHFKKGFKGIWNGKKFSEKHKKNLRKAHIGQKAWNKNLKTPLQVRLKTSKSNHYNWKGGITSLREMIRATSENRSWKQEVFKRDNYTCQKCKQVGHYLEAHHIKAFKIIVAEFLREYDQFSPIDDKETLVRLAIKYKPFWNIDNGETRCKKCHKINADNDYYELGRVDS